jgi:hypothetical protein
VTDNLDVFTLISDGKDEWKKENGICKQQLLMKLRKRKEELQKEVSELLNN